MTKQKAYSPKQPHKTTSAQEQEDNLLAEYNLEYTTPNYPKMIKANKSEQEIMNEVFGTKENYNKFQKAISELRYEVDRESECQDIINFIEELIKKIEANFKIAINKSFEAGKQQAQQDEIKFLKKYLWDETLNGCKCKTCNQINKRIRKLKQEKN